MEDSIPSLRRLVNELRAEVRALKSRPVEVVEKIVNVNVDRVIDRPVYQDNPDHIATIRKLQEKLCQYTSQSDL